MLIREYRQKSILEKSSLMHWVLNPTTDGQGMMTHTNTTGSIRCNCWLLSTRRFGVVLTRPGTFPSPDNTWIPSLPYLCPLSLVTWPGATLHWPPDSLSQGFAPTGKLNDKTLVFNDGRMCFISKPPAVFD